MVPKITAFISYSHKDSKYGAQAKAVLAKLGIEAFLAHDDLHVSDEWRERIMKELKRCDIFVPLLSANFVESKWAPQEVGFIVSRGAVVVILPVSLDGTPPFGFISHLHGRTLENDSITDELLVDPLARCIPRKIVPFLIRSVVEAASFRSGEARMRALVPFFAKLTAQEAQALAEASVDNNQIWSENASRTKYLPAFIDAQKGNIEANTLRALRYQIEHNRPYHPAYDSEDV